MADEANVSGFMVLEPAQRRLVERARAKLVGSGNSELAETLSSLVSIDIFGTARVRRTEAEKFAALLQRLYADHKEAIDMTDRELQTLQSELNHSVDAVSATLRDAKRLTKDMQALDARISKAVASGRKIIAKSA